MRAVRFEGILELPPILRFVPEEHFKMQLHPVSIVHISLGFLGSIHGLVEERLDAAQVCIETLQRKFYGDDLFNGLRLGQAPTYFGHIYEAMKGQPNGSPESEFAERWTKKREPGSAPLLIERHPNSFVYFDAEGSARVARLFYYDRERARNSEEYVSMAYPRSGWVISERHVGSADWAYPGERVGHYNV